jgi:hypothetical protein
MDNGLCHICFSSNVLVVLVDDLPTCNSCIQKTSS